MKPSRILVVDDEEEIRNRYCSILGQKCSSKELFNQEHTIYDDVEETVLTDGEQILSTDDGPQIQVEDGLLTNFYEFEEASQGQDAVKTVKQSLIDNRPFSLMILDMRLPFGAEVFETARLVRQIDPDVEIVIVTASSDYNFEEIVKEVGNPDRILCFYKPFDPKQIRQLASSLNQQWHLEKKSLEQENIKDSYINRSSNSQGEHR